MKNHQKSTIPTGVRLAVESARDDILRNEVLKRTSELSALRGALASLACGGYRFAESPLRDMACLLQELSDELQEFADGEVVQQAVAYVLSGLPKDDELPAFAAARLIKSLGDIGFEVVRSTDRLQLAVELRRARDAMFNVPEVGGKFDRQHADTHLAACQSIDDILATLDHREPAPDFRAE